MQYYIKIVSDITMKKKDYCIWKEEDNIKNSQLLVI